MYTEDELIDSNNTTMNFASPETNSMLKVKSKFLQIWFLYVSVHKETKSAKSLPNN